LQAKLKQFQLLFYLKNTNNYKNSYNIRDKYFLFYIKSRKIIKKEFEEAD